MLWEHRARGILQASHHHSSFDLAGLSTGCVAAQPRRGPAGTINPTAGRWVIRHSSADYKTGRLYGERPPLVLAPFLYPELEAFINTWRAGGAPGLCGAACMGPAGTCAPCLGTVLASGPSPTAGPLVPHHGACLAAARAELSPQAPTLFIKPKSGMPFSATAFYEMFSYTAEVRARTQ